jgi:hypothetical protein
LPPEPELEAAAAEDEDEDEDELEEEEEEEEETVATVVASDSIGLVSKASKIELVAILRINLNSAKYNRDRWAKSIKDSFLSNLAHTDSSPDVASIANSCISTV